MPSSQNSIQDQINLVGEGTVFEGTLRAESDVRASGKIVGKLDVNGKAIVAESGVVDGEIAATNADIAGQVDGEIHVAERLVLKSTAEVNGNIETDRLVVEEGAVFTGECRMGDTLSPDDESGADRQAPDAANTAGKAARTSDAGTSDAGTSAPGGSGSGTKASASATSGSSSPSPSSTTASSKAGSSKDADADDS